jgi:hypothetical protein
MEQVESRVAAVSYVRAKRASLFVLHLLILIALFRSTPSSYAYQLGYSLGAFLTFTTFGFWIALFLARTRKSFAWCCVFALVQLGVFGWIVLRYRAEDRVVRQVSDELQEKRNGWEKQFSQYNFNPLFEMCSGKRRLSDADLRDLRAQAQAAQADVSTVLSESHRSYDEAEARIAKVSPDGARDFRRGLEDGRPDAEELLHRTQSFYAEVEQLTTFLIERERHFQVASTGLVFDSTEDAKACNQRLETIRDLQQRVSTQLEKVQQRMRDAGSPSP